jgi:hypothetical protein
LRVKVELGCGHEARVRLGLGLWLRLMVELGCGHEAIGLCSGIGTVKTTVTFLGTLHTRHSTICPFAEHEMHFQNVFVFSKQQTHSYDTVIIANTRKFTYRLNQGEKKQKANLSFKNSL